VKYRRACANQYGAGLQMVIDSIAADNIRFSPDFDADSD